MENNVRLFAVGHLDIFLYASHIQLKDIVWIQLEACHDAFDLCILLDGGCLDFQEPINVNVCHPCVRIIYVVLFVAFLGFLLRGVSCPWNRVFAGWDGEEDVATDPACMSSFADSKDKPRRSRQS